MGSTPIRVSIFYFLFFILNLFGYICKVMKNKKIYIVIKAEDILRTRVGKGYTVKPMVQMDKRKETNKKACRIPIG